LNECVVIGVELQFIVFFFAFCKKKILENCNIVTYGVFKTASRISTLLQQQSQVASNAPLRLAEL